MNSCGVTRTMLSNSQVPVVFWLISVLSHCSSAFELHDTIHTLKEENFHLQHRLDNLTHALRDLKHLLMEHSKVSGLEHDAEYLHVWRQWSQHSISAETHRMLERTLCLTELHAAAPPVSSNPGFLLFLSPHVILTLLS